jgi:hypothetical protein
MKRMCPSSQPNSKSIDTHSISNSHYYRNSKLRGDREWPLVGIFHFIVLTGLGLVASGASAFKGVDVKPIDLTLLKVGITILLLTWVVLCIWSLLSLLPSQRTIDAPGFVGGTKACLSPSLYDKYQVLLTFD